MYIHFCHLFHLMSEISDCIQRGNGLIQPRREPRNTSPWLSCLAVSQLPILAISRDTTSLCISESGPPDHHTSEPSACSRLQKANPTLRRLRSHFFTMLVQYTKWEKGVLIFFLFYSSRKHFFRHHLLQVLQQVSESSRLLSVSSHDRK